MQAPRTPQNCPYRGVGTGSQDGQMVCKAITRITGAADHGVDQAICQACCTYPLPSGPSINPVIASLVLCATEQTANGHQDVRQVIKQRQSRVFAASFLTACEAPGSTVPFHSEQPTHFKTAPARESRRVSERMPRLGLIGRNSRFGLGHVNRDIAAQLNVDRWLIPHFGNAVPPPSSISCRIDSRVTKPNEGELAEWLEGLQAVMFVEEPSYEALPQIARRAGVRVICVPNWEWLQPALPWLADVDLMLCPTRFTAQYLADWKARFAFPWMVESVNWPINVDSFPYRRRYVCRKFVYVHGSGGSEARAEDRITPIFRRKGLEVLLNAAGLVPEIPVIVYAAPDHLAFIPRNAELRPPPIDNDELYEDGDVCVQPSHWEGLGLPLLECQATGMPLITTDAPPMNEHEPYAVIPATDELAWLGPDLLIPAARMCPEDLARIMKSVHRRWIYNASGRARKFVERHHDWRLQRGKILELIADLVFQNSPDMPESEVLPHHLTVH